MVRWCVCHWGQAAYQPLESRRWVANCAHVWGVGGQLHERHLPGLTDPLTRILLSSVQGGMRQVAEGGGRPLVFTSNEKLHRITSAPGGALVFCRRRCARW